jgi:hypothetical protein
MLEVDQDLKRLAHDRVRPPALDMRDEADAARIMFVRRIVEALGGGGCLLFHSVLMNDLGS